MRIVLDTNVLVSALISGKGSPGRLLAMVKRKHFTLVTSNLIVSGDKTHLLALGHVEGIPIVAPREAVVRLQGRPEKDE